MARRYSSNRSGNMMTVVSGAIIVVVLGLGIFAVSGKISNNINANKAAKGDSSIEYYADQQGMELADFIEQYGLSADEVNPKDSIMDVAAKMTLENYSKFAWGTELTDDEFNAFKKDQEIADDVAKDTKDQEVITKYNSYMSAKQAAEEAAKEAANAENTAGESVEIPAENTAEETEATEATEAAESTEAAEKE